MENKLDYEKFKDRLGSWGEKLKPFITGKDCWNIYQELKKCKEEIYPASENTWRAFKECRIDELKCIFVGQSPYHTAEGGIPLADGLAFSCGNTKKESPSLKILLDALQDDLGKEIVRETDLTFWAMQGVLLLNTSLTTLALKGDSHRQLWQPFIKFLFKEVLDVYTGIPIVLFGETAKKEVESYLFPLSQPYICVKHPAFFSRNNTPMEHKNLFTWCNKILKENNKEEIYWDKKDFDELYCPF